MVQMNPCILQCRKIKVQNCVLSCLSFPTIPSLHLSLSLSCARANTLSLIHTQRPGSELAGEAVEYVLARAAVAPAKEVVVVQVVVQRVYLMPLLEACGALHLSHSTSSWLQGPQQGTPHSMHVWGTRQQTHTQGAASCTCSLRDDVVVAPPEV